MGAAFVYVGAKVAPSYRQNIAFLLAAIGLLIASIAVYLAIRELNYPTLWAALWGTIGTATIVYGVSSGDISLD
jgi:peptidoglycan/LPS O-acetylase OafA/YrhL